MSCGIKPIKRPIISSFDEWAFKCNLEVATAPIINAIIASVPFMLMLKWILSVIKNINKPDMPIICILALNFKIANIKQVIFDRRIPRKKKCNSMACVGVSIRWRTITITIQFKISG